MVVGRITADDLLGNDVDPDNDVLVPTNFVSVAGDVTDNGIRRTGRLRRLIRPQQAQSILFMQFLMVRVVKIPPPQPSVA